jgi:Uncharacterised nucleotidyltransferase
MRERAKRTLGSSPSRTSELNLLRVGIAAAIGYPEEQDILALAFNTRWLSFVTLALNHHVAGLAHSALSRIPEGVVPQPIIAQLARHACEIMRQRAAGIAEIDRISAALAQGGVPVIPIKGPTVRQRLYGAVAAGPSRDLDLLLPDDQQAAALRILAECGYSSAAGLTPRQARALMTLRGQDVMSRRDGRFVIEPHFALGPSNLAFKIDHAGLWKRASIAVDDAPNLLVLAPEDEFILLALHGGKEEWTRLKWLADLAVFLLRYPNLDWDVICRRAKRQRLMNTIGLAALMLTELTAREIPLAAAARRNPGLQALAQRIALQWEQPASARSVFAISPCHWVLCDSAVARASYLARTIVTPRSAHYRFVRLPDWMFPAYYPIKVIHDYLLLPVWILAKTARAAMHDVRVSGSRFFLRRPRSNRRR